MVAGVQPRDDAGHDLARRVLAIAQPADRLAARHLRELGIERGGERGPRAVAGLRHGLEQLPQLIVHPRRTYQRQDARIT